MAKDDEARPYCDVRPQTVPVLSPTLPDTRSSAILLMRAKWVNGTVLHYHFLGGPERQRQAVRDAFAEWKAIDIGLEFTEVDTPSEAEVRIAFDQSDGSWSYVGRDVLGINVGEPTMNFGWDLTTPYGRVTALHEIGHTLGLPHEHQNPFAGIVWDEPKVYAYFAGPPNNWSQSKTFHNVLRKLAPSEVEGSEWDPESVMEYAFPSGLIVEPPEYSAGIPEPDGLSELDRQWARQWFPPLTAAPPRLEPFTSRPLSLSPGQQVDFRIEPPESRTYQIATFGHSDTVLVLFEEVDGELRYVRGDDDSGTDRNAHLSVRLFRGRRYVARLRLYWSGASGQTALMYW